MAADYAEKEREFLDSLEADTGKDLGAWMAAISGAGLGHRNDIIDWLRRQGFTFSRASNFISLVRNQSRGSSDPEPLTSATLVSLSR